MKIECPHCGQHIELEGSGVTEFSCPTCNGLIQLEVTADAARPPAAVSASPGQGIKLPVLLGSIAGGMGLSLLAGWLIWGRMDHQTDGRPDQGGAGKGTPQGIEHGVVDQPKRRDSREEAIIKALTRYWAASSAEERINLVRMQPDTANRMRTYYQYDAPKPTEVELVGIYSHMPKVTSMPTISNFDTGTSLPDGFVFVHYRNGSRENLAEGKGWNRWGVFELNRDSKNDAYTAKLDWESHTGWNPKTLKALKAQKEEQPTIVRCVASIDEYNRATTTEEREKGWKSISIEEEGEYLHISAAIPVNFHDKDKLLEKISDGEDHHIMLEIRHRSGDADSGDFIVTDYVNDTWLIPNEPELFSKLEKQAEIRQLHEWWYGFGYATGRRAKSYAVNLGGVRQSNSRFGKMVEMQANSEVMKFSDDFLKANVGVRRTRKIRPVAKL